jgi:membrane fusion protein, copper/silver efflux system
MAQRDSRLRLAQSRRSSPVLTEIVHRGSDVQVIRTTGIVTADENKIYRLNAESAGRLISLGSNSPGTIVRKDEVLATFFSNEFVKAEQAYFFSLQALQRDKAGAKADVQKSEESVRSQEGVLISMGMGEPQLRQLAETRQATRDIAITSPANGMILSRSLYPAQVLEEDQEMYRIAALDKVWVFASLSPGEMAAMAPSTEARVTVRRTGKVLVAKVKPAVSLANDAGQALQLKLEVENPELRLRPDMVVDVELRITNPLQITVPAAAIIDTGFEHLIFVEAGYGTCRPRIVEIGNKVGDRVIVRHGLADGEKVVVSANFLFDSETRLHR